MKFVLPAVFLLYSGFSFADYHCSEPDSQLTLKRLGNSGVKVTLVDTKRPTRVPLTKDFYGKEVQADPADYFKVEVFKLLGNSGAADLKVTTIPVLSRVPTCRTRVCDVDTGNYNSFEISAEFDHQGKSVQYECFKS